MRPKELTITVQVLGTEFGEVVRVRYIVQSDIDLALEVSNIDGMLLRRYLVPAGSGLADNLEHVKLNTLHASTIGVISSLDDVRDYERMLRGEG